MSPPKFICLNPKAHCDGIKQGALAYEGRALMNEINVLIKEAQENTLAPLPVRI